MRCTSPTRWNALVSKVGVSTGCEMFKRRLVHSVAVTIVNFIPGKNVLKYKAHLNLNGHALLCVP